jgi:acetate kinase
MSSTVLVLNSGSSSIKYQLVDPISGQAMAKGLLDRIGEETSRLRHEKTDKTGTETLDISCTVADHAAGLRLMLDTFAQTGPDLSEASLSAVGHRVVHGGEKFTKATFIDDEVEQAIDELSPLAPLHNPPNLTGIRVARRTLPDVPHVAVFDTAFHHTLPPASHTYAIDRELARTHGVRRYGFHGTSVDYVTRRATRLLGSDITKTNMIVLHLGNGASATAVRGGESIDTSMGLTPLEGLVMGTRSGDIDPGVIFYLSRQLGLDINSLDVLLNRRSGMLGLASSNDMRDVHRQAADGDQDARLAREVYCHRIRHYVGAYIATLGRVDAIVFTAGVGENDSWVRFQALRGMGRLGIEIDQVRNASNDRRSRFISPDNADVAVLVVPTNEELEIARQSMSVVAAHSA